MIEGKRILEFLAEDLGFGDVTTEALIPEEIKARAVILAKQAGVIAGIDEVSAIFRLFNLKIRTFVTDGSKVERPKTIVMEVEEPAKFILMCERVALNILMRMSGIATLTAKFVEKARKVNSKVLVACTRKTTPGFRYFEKKAVMMGGGDTHRFRLDDMVLIKDNHIKIVGSVGRAVKMAAVSAMKSTPQKTTTFASV
ncbi:carboxylating nicotinate-nucleotide diphosphorylase [Candidatus Bathyarchaeota archaeon]|nr:carboxylating nicotinate-nucleotide diphosphorylase [Candidatus Bathyarchaeota archaeon]